MKSRHTAWLFAVLTFIGSAFPAARAQEQQGGDGRALLVGVKGYDRNELRSLQYPEADVIDLADALKAAGYKPDHVVVMTQATGEANERHCPWPG